MSNVFLTAPSGRMKRTTRALFSLRKPVVVSPEF